MKHLRVFYTLRTRRPGTLNFDKKKEFRDFGSTLHPEVAYEDLYRELGRETDGRDTKAPDRYIRIYAHTLVDTEAERPTLETFTAYEVPLLDALTLKACLSDAPKKKLRRTW